jgi:orotate phosphoribosyltransferase
MSLEVAEILPVRSGHFVFESGHHGNVWLDLERLCLRVDPIKRFAGDIAVRVSRYKPDIICAPLVEGAFVGMMVALELGLPFTYSERIEGVPTAGLYPIRYRLPGALRAEVPGKRVAIVNDVINAGSAVHGTYLDLIQCEAMPVVIGCLAVLGEFGAETFGIAVFDHPGHENHPPGWRANEQGLINPNVSALADWSIKAKPGRRFRYRLLVFRGSATRETL